MEIPALGRLQIIPKVYLLDKRGADEPCVNSHSAL